MKRIAIILGALIIVGAIAASARLLLRDPPAPLDPMDYSESEAWLSVPDPAPVWEGGWAIDVLALHPEAGLTATHADPIGDKQISGARATLPESHAALSTIGAAFSPFYRSPALQDDARRALDAYLASHNEGRAFVIATADPDLRLSLAPDVRKRFGGYILLGGAEPDPNALEDPATCPERGGACAAAFDPSAPISASLLNGFADYLENDVGKLAEPLGGFEEIEIIDIREPGDTDENRTDIAPED